jgi:VWFA-related protein
MRGHWPRVVVAAAAIATGALAVTWPSVAVPVARRLSAAAAQDEQRPVFRGGTSFVYLDVYPRRDGQVIEGLNKDDFEVTEDGKPQTIDTFQFVKYETAIPDAERRDPTSLADSERQAADPKNRVFVVYLDPYSVEFENAAQVKSVVMTFLTRTIGASDLFGLATPEIPISRMTFARRLETLEGDLDEFLVGLRSDGLKKDRPRTPLEERLYGCVDYDRDAFKPVVTVLRQDLLMTSLENAMVRLGALRDERKNLLLVSEGWSAIVSNGGLSANQRARGSMPQVGVSPRGRLGTNNVQPLDRDDAWCNGMFARLSSIDFPQRSRDLLTRARQANVSFYPVDVGGLRAPALGDASVRTPADAEQADEKQKANLTTLRMLAENTDGIPVFNTNDVTGAVRRLTNSLSAVYLLGYYSTNTANDGRYRQIRVRLKQGKADVSARPGYFAPSAALAAAASRATPAAPPTAIDDELGRLARIRPDADLFSYAAVDSSQLTVVAELSSREIESGRWKTGARVKATIQTTGGAPSTVEAAIDPGARVAALIVPTASASGPWKVDVRVSNDGQALDSSVSAARPSGRLFADPLLFRANPSPRAPLKPVADFQFRRTERIHVEWRALKTLTGRTAKLLDAKGQPLPVEPALTSRDDDGRAVVVLDLNLAPLSEGNYVIELTGTAGTEQERELLAFKIVR